MTASQSSSAVGQKQTALWWQNAVIYHVYVPSFRDGNGDGIGDLWGLIDGLGYLDEVLGVDAIWVSPFFVSPWLDGGYDIACHTRVEPRFGDLETFRRLLDLAHGRGLRVIIDYVPNHTSDQHPWFLESRSSRESPKRDWYVWADARDGERLPNNWVSEAGGSVWEWDPVADQFYLHSHLVEQPDLNWRNEHVRRAMLDVLRFWLDLGVDGFRVDVAHELMKDPELRDNPPNPDGELNPYDRQHPDFHTQLHVNDRRHPDLHEVLREIRALLDDYGDRVAIGELDVMPWAEWAEYYGADLDELHLPMNFSLIETPWEARAVTAALKDLAAALPPGAWPVNNLGNHDRSRLSSRYGEDGARMAAVLLLTARGTPILYYGDELGMSDVEIPRDRLRDGYSRMEGGPTRDPNRTPMPWDASPRAGFSPAGSDPWLPLGPDWRRRNVAHQLVEPGSMLSLYRRLLELRRHHDELRIGELRILDFHGGSCLMYERRLADAASLVALNFGSKAKSVEIPYSRARILASTAVDRAGEPVVDRTIELRAGEGVVVQRLAFAGRDE